MRFSDRKIVSFLCVCVSNLEFQGALNPWNHDYIRRFSIRLRVVIGVEERISSLKCLWRFLRDFLRVISLSIGDYFYASTGFIMDYFISIFRCVLASL